MIFPFTEEQRSLLLFFMGEKMGRLIAEKDAAQSKEERDRLHRLAVKVMDISVILGYTGAAQNLVLDDAKK